MRVTLIHNPGAGDEHPDERDLISLIEKAGHDPVYESMEDNNIDAALKDPGDLVVVAGGDGTVRKVAMRLLETGVPMTILPLGTANNIALALGISGSIEELIAGWASGKRKRFNTGLVSGHFGEARFIEGFGIGLFSKAMSLLNSIDDEHSIEFNDSELKLYSDLGSLKALLPDYRAHNLSVTLDGKDLSGRYLMLEAMNINSVGPNLLLAPDADVSDDHLDFAFVSEDEREAFAAYLTALLEGGDAPSSFTVRKGERLEVRCEDAEIHLDDRIWTKRISGRSKNTSDANSISVSIAQEALEILVPDRQAD